MCIFKFSSCSDRCDERYADSLPFLCDIEIDKCRLALMRARLKSSVADPNPDPHAFGPPGSGSTSQRYGSGSGTCSGSGSGSFYHHAKIVRKTLIPIIL
jgi:hypothetical protein